MAKRRQKRSPVRIGPAAMTEKALLRRLGSMNALEALMTLYPEAAHKMGDVLCEFYTQINRDMELGGLPLIAEVATLVALRARGCGFVTELLRDQAERPIGPRGIAPFDPFKKAKMAADRRQR